VNRVRVVFSNKKDKMKAVSVHNLKRLKRALQKQKLKRIDSYRMQVCCCDANQRAQIEGSDVPELVKDHNGQFMILSEDASGRQYLKPFRLLSNTAYTNLEMHAIQRDIIMPGPIGTGQATPDNIVIKQSEQALGEKNIDVGDVDSLAADFKSPQEEEQKEDLKLNK